MEIICKSCGFTNPESSQYCTLCGVPFLNANPQATVSNVRSPSKQAGGDSEEAIDYDSVLAMTADGRRKVQKTDSDESGDELDSLLSDFDGTFPTLKK